MTDGGSQPDRDPLPLEVERQIDRLCDEFEEAWKRGRSPHIEHYLDRVPARHPHRGKLIGEGLADRSFGCRRFSGGTSRR